VLIIGSGRLVLITGTSGQHNRPGRPYNRPLAVSSVIVKVATYQFGSRTTVRSAMSTNPAMAIRNVGPTTALHFHNYSAI